MKKFLFPVSIITTLFILVACVADKNPDQLATNGSVLNTETTIIEEIATQESTTSEQESTTQEAVSENESTEAIGTTKEHTTEKQTDAVVPTTQKNIEQTTISSEKETTNISTETITNITAETTTATAIDIISKEEAKKIVLKHTGLSEADIIRFSIELDREITGTKYDIDFRTAEYEYEYELDAKSGKIIKSEKEAEKTLKPQTTPENTTVPTETTTEVPETTTTTPETTTTNVADSLITKQQAKEIALKHAKVKEADIRGYEIELDKEISRIIYEISFHAGSFEYDYEINAEDGRIIKSEREAERVQHYLPETTTAAPESTTSTSEILISKAQAKQLVLNHACISENDIRNYRIELDREIHKTTYDIDFYAGEFEYEYEINAKNGNIIKSEKEHID